MVFFSIGSNKVLSEGGYAILFYQWNWKVVGDNAYKLIKEVFQDHDLHDINKTLVYLISKFDKSYFINHF